MKDANSKRIEVLAKLGMDQAKLSLEAARLVTERKRTEAEARESIDELTKTILREKMEKEKRSG